ncbi:MAG: hypothetical protein ACRCY4_01715 [Brevinema sp.]
MKRVILLGLFLLSMVAPSFAQIRSINPILSFNFTGTIYSHQENGDLLYQAGGGIGLHFMIGGRLYFFGGINAGYLASITTATDSFQLAFLVGLGYVLIENRDIRGFSLAINVAPLGIGLDARNLGTINQLSSALYHFYVDVPLRFHYERNKAVQVAPYITLGLDTRNNMYNFAVSGGVSVGFTY